jgi:hypothetical protein
MIIIMLHAKHRLLSSTEVDFAILFLFCTEVLQEILTCIVIKLCIN